MYKLIDFKKYTSINIGGLHKVRIIDEKGDYTNYKIIGRGNNLLISDNPPPLAILGDKFDYIMQKNGRLIVGAATTSGKLLTYCKKNDIANFEFLAKLPGNIGGLTKMNAGLKQWEIFNHIYSISTNKGTFLKDQITHSYRYTDIEGIIFEVAFNIEKGYDTKQQKLFTTMRDNQPNLPSAGSCFKNPETIHSVSKGNAPVQEKSAGYLLEQAGLKGYTIGGMAFSSLHANFLVNIGNGTYDEALELINTAKKKVNHKFNIELQEEIIII